MEAIFAEESGMNSASVPTIKLAAVNPSIQRSAAPARGVSEGKPILRWGNERCHGASRHCFPPWREGMLRLNFADGKLGKYVGLLS